MFYTKVLPKVIDDTQPKNLYNFLTEVITWDEGIKTRSGESTRLGYAVDMDVYGEIFQPILDQVLKASGLKNLMIFGLYLNWYKDGSMWTPNHSHGKMKQIVISLGATRTLNVGKKSYPMNNGDVIMFGSITHVVPKEPLIREGRISIACLFADSSLLDGLLGLTI